MAKFGDDRPRDLWD